MTEADSIGRFAEIILPLPLAGTLTYRIPLVLSQQVKPGIRVAVPLGPSRIYAGIVRTVHGRKPEHEAREIMEVIDQEPVLGDTHLRFWEWLASYYMCNIGEVMNAALPMPVRAGSEVIVELHPAAAEASADANDIEFRILSALRSSPCPISAIPAIAGIRKVKPILENLREKNLIRFKFEWQDAYKPKYSRHVAIRSEFCEEEKLRQLMDELGRKAPKQLECLMVLVQHGAVNAKIIPKKVLTRNKQISPSAYNALVKKGILEESDREESYFESRKASRKQEEIEFNDVQQEAFSSIREQFQNHDAVLLHGITGSGKTELYIRLIHEALERGEQVLYLVPEIALTSQLVERLQSYFGSLVGVFHSRYSAMQRTEAWLAVQKEGEGSFPIVLGARSAVFLPFRRLGLIIVDEEHDSSYKQYDPAPRYHARDVAIYLARLTHAKILLGTATPSIESYFNSKQGKFGYVEMKKRFGQARLPEIWVADMEEAYRKRQVKSHFSQLLVDHMRRALDEGEQVILFQNRRGFSLRMECETCHWMPQCKNCDVTLIYHKGISKLKCHYCGYSMAPPTTCDSCQGTRLQLKGFGTEKIEEELPLLFPETIVARLDLDTTRSKNTYTRTIKEFEQGKIDILVGTQMVSKGLDFDNVGVVGIMNADNMLNFPDFRAFERSYQHLAQVSGRAGRKEKKGFVVIQTFQPYHPVIRQVMVNDYVSMYHDQILERRNFKYPPFIRLIRITFLHKDRETLNRCSRELSISFRRILGNSFVLGPEYPLILRLKGYFQRQTLLKLPRDHKLGAPKREINKSIHSYINIAENKGLRVIIDVDPV